MDSSWQDAVEIIQGGGVGVIPTDTLYGIVASAFQPDAIDRIYTLKQRDPRKPLIVLIADITQLEQFVCGWWWGLHLDMSHSFPRMGPMARVPRGSIDEPCASL